jgi:hypothetical protein
MSSASPLDALKSVSQNFPKHMLPISRKIETSEDFEEEVRENSANIQPGMNLLWINGYLMQDESVNPFGFALFLQPQNRLD